MSQGILIQTILKSWSSILIRQHQCYLLGSSSHRGGDNLIFKSLGLVQEWDCWCISCSITHSRARNTRKIWTVGSYTRVQLSYPVRPMCLHTVFPIACLCLFTSSTCWWERKGRAYLQGERWCRARRSRSWIFLFPAVQSPGEAWSSSQGPESKNWITVIFLRSIYHPISLF